MTEELRVQDENGGYWRVGIASDIAWITSTPGRAITAAIPPVFEAYATVLTPASSGSPRDLAEERAHDRALLDVLEAHTSAGAWWLGYLDTGASDIVFWDAPKVSLYSGWEYVFVLAGPNEAWSWRPADRPDWRRRPNWKSSELPDVMFPESRSWLASMLWDDDWFCVGGSRELIDALLSDPTLTKHARRVEIDEDATPPGHTAS